MIGGRWTVVVAMVAVTGCGFTQRALESACLKQCETEQRRFEAIEDCRAQCRATYDALPSPGDDGEDAPGASGQ